MDCLSLIRLASDFGMLPENTAIWPTECLSKFSLVNAQLSAENQSKPLIEIPCEPNFRKEFSELRRSIRRLRQVDFSRFAIYKTVMSESMSNFTPRAQQVLVLQEEAIDFTTIMGTEHLLLGLINLGQASPYVLQKMGLDLDTVRQAVDEQVGLGLEAKPSVTLLTPRG